MNKIFSILIFILSSVVFSQSASEIVKTHFEKSGGYNNWNTLNSIKIKGEVTIGLSDAIPIIIEHTRPYFKRVSYIIDGKEILNEGYDGRKAFTFDARTSEIIPLPVYTPDAFETDLLNYNKKGFNVEYLGKEKVNNREAFKIKLTTNTEHTLYWIDIKDYQIVKEENKLETIYYSNFKRFGKLTFATKMEYIPHGGNDYMVIFHNVIPNASIPNSRYIFDK